MMMAAEKEMRIESTNFSHEICEKASGKGYILVFRGTRIRREVVAIL